MGGPRGGPRTKLAAAEEAEAETQHNAAVAAAESTFTKYLNTFADATLKGDVKEARKTAAEAKADPALKELAPKVQGFADVCAALDKADAARLAALEKLKDGKEHSLETKKETVKGVVTAATAEAIDVHRQIAGGGGGSAGQKIHFAELVAAQQKLLAGDFKPETPAEHLAEGIRALAGGIRKPPRASWPRPRISR